MTCIVLEGQLGPGTHDCVGHTKSRKLVEQVTLKLLTSISIFLSLKECDRVVFQEQSLIRVVQTAN